MIDLLFRLSNLTAPASAFATPAADDPTSGTIGFIVLGIIVGPVIILTIASMLGHPRTFRIPGLFMGALILLIGGMVLSFLAVGILLKFIVPQ